jgi:2-phosphoglycerate kinase
MSMAVPARPDQARSTRGYNPPMHSQRPWSVLLLGGASGVGKTSVSYRLAQHYGIGITEVDDFQVILEGMTAPDQYPELHYWRTHYDEARAMDEDAHLDFMKRYSGVMAAALALVIGNHIETRVPILLEGDFILPSLAVQAEYAGIPAAGQVRTLFLYEPDEQQIRRNYRSRDGADQPERARISWRVSEWLRGECARLGVPSLPARPWETVLERAIACVDGTDPEPGLASIAP